MEQRVALMVSAFFTLMGLDEIDYETIFRNRMAQSDLKITREDIATVRKAWYPHPEWSEAEFELYRILEL